MFFVVDCTGIWLMAKSVDTLFILNQNTNYMLVAKEGNRIPWKTSSFSYRKDIERLNKY